MKKYLILILACGFSLSLFAQSEVTENKRETPKSKEYLPVAGDVTLGINMIPFLNYFGNMFNGNTSNKLNPQEIGGVPSVPGLSAGSFSIFGKYFLTDRTAVRLNLGIQANTKNNKFYSVDQAALVNDPISEAQVEDVYKQNNSGFSLAAGYEWRRGYKRLQGFWGGQLILAYSVSKDKFTYGNAITEANQSPANGMSNTTPTPNVGGNSRLLSVNHGNSFIGGLGGFTGVEYYIAPKIAIGCELSLNMLWQKTGKTTQVSERFNDRFNDVQENTRHSKPGDSGFHFGTENIGTSLFVAFSF